MRNVVQQVAASHTGSSQVRESRYGLCRLAGSRLLCLALPIALAGCALSGARELSSEGPPPPPPPVVFPVREPPFPVTMEPPPPPPPAQRGERDGEDYEHGGARGHLHSRALAAPAATAGVGDEALLMPAAGPSDERVFCDITGKFMSARMCGEARTIAANARQGLGRVDYPDTITRGERRMVSFTVRRAAPGENLPPSDASVTAAHQPFTLKVTGRMAALLAGEGFKIEPDKLQYRDIGISDAARWEWYITALKAPHHHLTLTAYMVVEGSDGSTTDSAIVPSKEIDIPVRVTWQQRFSDLAESLVALSASAKAIIAALTALLIALIGFRSKLAELTASLLGRGAPQQG